MALILQAAHAGDLDPDVTVSWVWAASVCTGIITLVMSLTMRLPMIAAWSIPGSVLLISGLQRYDIHELVGVYIVVGIVSVILSATGVFTTLVNLIPAVGCMVVWPACCCRCVCRGFTLGRSWAAWAESWWWPLFVGRGWPR